MDFIWDFIKNFTYELIFSIVLSSGLAVAYFSGLRNWIVGKSLGINKIHKRGLDLKSVSRSINHAMEIDQISYLPINFVCNYRLDLIRRISKGCAIKFLISNPNTDMLIEASQMEIDTNDNILPDYEKLIATLRKIRREAGGNGTIEVRTFNTEIRNPVSIFTDARGDFKAFATVAFPPATSINCMMIEFRKNQGKDARKYFEKIWNRHENDRVLKI